MGDGTISEPASCCHQDNDIALGWCMQPGAADDPRYDAACSPFHPDFGETNWAVGGNGSLQVADPTRWQDVAHESGFCEVLGRVRVARSASAHSGRLIPGSMIAPAAGMLRGHISAVHDAVRVPRRWPGMSMRCCRASHVVAPPQGCHLASAERHNCLFGTPRLR